jgi:hypothetical protein
MLANLRGALPARAALGFAVALLATPASAGKLADAGRATRSSSSSSSSRSSSDSGTSGCCDRGGSDFAILILSSPWTGPYYALETDQRGAPVYEDYPYARGSNGLLRYPTLEAEADAGEGKVDSATNEERSEAVAPRSGKSVAAQLRAEGGYILGGLYRGGLGARLMTPGRLELDANFHTFAEPLPNGLDDRATFANVHLGLRFAQSEHVQFHTALGYQQFADAQGVEPGIDFLYGFEVEPGAHLVLSFSGDLGSAGQAFVGQARASLGVMVGPIEVFAGYDHISIGGVELGGPDAGIRAWL